MKPYQIINPILQDRICAYAAQSSDADAVMKLLQQTARWLQSKGSSQWSQLLDGHDVHGMVDAIDRGDVFIFKACETDTLAAVVMLLQEPSEWDRQLWGAEAVSESALYVHRLAINRDFAATGLGPAVMEWIQSGITFPGKRFIRLDCIAGNDKLYHFYSHLGFQYKVSHTAGWNCFEKAIHT